MSRQRAMKKRSRKRTRSVWMAAGTLAAYAVVRPNARALAAETVADAAGGAAAPATLPVRRFEIAPGPLGAVLEAYRAASGVKVSVPDAGLLQIPSPGVTGVMSIEVALKQLLVGTSVGFRFTSAGSAELTLDASEEMVVTGEAPLDISPKFTQPLLDTPQTISVVPQELMKEQANTTLREALRNVAGVSIAAGEGGFQGDSLTLRGFSARNDIYVDGMRDFGSYYRDPFHLQQVEVLKGPSSSEFGRGSTGGVINQSTKLPNLQPRMGAEAFIGTNNTYRATVDIDQTIPAFGEGSAFQLSAMGNQNHVAGRDVTQNQRWGVAPSVAFGLDGPTQLTLAYFHLTANDIPDYGVPWYFNEPAPVDRANYYGFEEGSFLDTTADMGTIRFSHEFTPNITIRDQARYASYGRNGRITEARLPTSATPDTPLDQIQINRNQIAAESTETFLQNQLDATFQFKTGTVGHTLVSGIEFGRETSDPIRRAYSGVPTTSFLRPHPSDPFAGTATISSSVEATSNTFAAYLLDTVALGKFEVTAGFRWDRFDTDYAQTVGTPLELSRVDEMPNWRAAIAYKPQANGTIYFDAGTSSNPSAEALSLSVANVDLSPEENQTFEVGTKWDFMQGQLSVRAALFQTEKLNAREPDPNDPSLNVLAGKQRVRGGEIEVSGVVTKDWRVNLAYAYLNGRLTESEAFPDAVGARLANVPENTFRLWNMFNLPWELQLGAGINYVSARTASSTVPNDPVTGLLKEAPSYVTFDAMVRRPITEALMLQLNLYNLGNTTYYDQLHPGHIVPGQGRGALFGIAANF
ncbi:MAG: TonB-dependent siderophore receptor [Thermoanaerobaculia bacterium]